MAFGIEILNEDAVVRMDWAFDGAELDLLAKALVGRKRVIDVEVVQTFIQGVVESIIANEVETHYNKREYMLSGLIQQGKSKEYITSYLRGWDMAGTHFTEKDA